MAASFLSIAPEHLGETFRDSNGPCLRLIGLNLRAKKRCLIIADAYGPFPAIHRS